MLETRPATNLASHPTQFELLSMHGETKWLHLVFSLVANKTTATLVRTRARLKQYDKVSGSRQLSVTLGLSLGPASARLKSVPGK